MGTTLNTEKFSTMVKSKRGNQGLRALAGEIQISASTLSRIEQGNLPDIETYMKICEWLKVSPEYFTIQTESENNPRNNVVAHLRADKDLPPETAEALIRMINLAYDAYKQE